MDFPQEYVSQATPAELFPCSMPTLYPDPNAYTPYSMPASSPPPTALSPLPMFAAYTGQNQVWLPPPSQSPFSYQYVSPVYSMYSQTTSPLVQQNLPPPRPASALATSLPYSYPEPAISGLPPSAVQHPLLPLNLTAHYESRPAQQPDLNHLEPEEGKGERASRVAHRLRMSSRHRSVSPQSHRFPLPQSSPRGANVSTEMSVNAEDLLLPPLPPPIFLSSAQAEAGDTVPVPMTDENEQVSCSPQPPLYFPRPMLSPKMSNGSLPRSDRVEELERIAAEVEDEVHSQKSSKTKSKRSKGKSKQRRTINSRTDINKTLPPPPVPTCKGYLSPDVSDYFNLQCSKPEQDIAGLSEIPPTPIPVPLDKAPPTPTLTAVTPVRHVRSNLTEKLAAGRVESGLDALERRLLAEVGTQKIERVFSSSGDVRNLFSGPSNAQTIQSKALSPSKIPEDASQPTKGRLSPIKIPPPRIGGDAGSDGLNIDSAISSLTLADGGWVMEADRRAREKEAEQGQDHVVEESATHEAHEERDSDEKTHRAGTVGGKSKSKSSFSGDDVREERKQLKKRHRRHAADELVVDSEREDGADSRGRSREGSVKGKKSGRKKECHKRRKSVKGRVTAWLGTIDPDAVPLEENFVGASHMDLGAAEQRSGMIGGDIDATGRTRQSEPERAATGANLSRSPTLPPPHVEPPQVDVPTSAPNPRSSGFMPMTTEKLETRRMSRHMMTTSERRHPNVKHDLKNIFAPMTCFDASTPTPEVREDLGLPTRPRTASGVVQISPSSPRPQSTSISAGRGDKSNVEDNLSAVKAPMGGLFKASLTTTMSRDISVQPSAQPLLRAPVPILAKQCQDPEIKYDVRSARGGRGGQVTAIAAFWAAAAAKEASTPGSSTPTKGSSPDVRSRRQAPSVVAPKPVMAQRVNKPLIANERRDNQPYKVAMTGKPLPVDTHKSPSPTTLNESSPKLLGLAGKTKPGTKSPSVPAVISSSLAIPMLSSTASLARPPTQQSRRPLVTPITNNLISAAEPPKCHSPTKARSTPDLAFGKARLRDLIKKYQEQGS
ncbi:hypothetical protein AX15_004527 [Amanita polypyramis BW_CC]|nr:hypothetical protein AX15_004527 [Amanita polypyramis BW_CC]